MTGRERCDGASLRPREDTIVYKMVGGVILKTHGACPHCGKVTALTIAGNIREHKPAKPAVA